MSVQEFKNKQPNSRDCFVCGLENPYGLHLQFYDDGEGQVMAEYTVADRFQGYPGTVHGGIIASMLDEVVGRTLMAGDPNHFFVSAKLTIRYRKTVPLGQPLKLSGKLIRDRGRTAVAKAELRLPDGSIGAEAEAILVDVPFEITEGVNFERLGWKVYPDDPASEE
jgi:acyl-coenzyme A thioesterase PaaI-like protein